MTTTNKPFQLGSISTGTLRTEDLLPAFIEAIGRLGGTLPSDLECVNHMEYTALPSYDHVGVIDDSIDFWQSDEAAWDWEALTTVLEYLCPPFVYFGTLEGDGADFGFWVNAEALGEAIRSETDTDESILNDSGILNLPESNVTILYNNDAVTLLDSNNTILWDCV
jgi:hypothetical protein